MRLGIIGVGKMGLSHLAIANQTKGLNVVAMCDSSKILVNALSKNTKIKGYSDHKKIISSENLDAVLICVPNAFHYQIAVDCLENNLHIFIEKPLTLNHQESANLVSLADRKNLIGQVGYTNRFNPIFAHLKKLLEEDVIGDILSYESKMLGGVILKDHTKGWRNDYSKGGGCLFDYGPHCIDLAVFLFGENINVKSAVLQKIYSSNVDDAVFALFDHENSFFGKISVNWSDPTVRKASNEIAIIGSKGKIVANKQEMKIYTEIENPALNIQTGWNEIYVTDLNTDVNYYLRGEDFSRQLENFSECINKKTQPVSSLSSAAVTDRLIHDIFENAGELR